MVFYQYNIPVYSGGWGDLDPEIGEKFRYLNYDVFSRFIYRNMASESLRLPPGLMCLNYARH